MVLWFSLLCGGNVLSAACAAQKMHSAKVAVVSRAPGRSSQEKTTAVLVLCAIGVSGGSMEGCSMLRVQVGRRRGAVALQAARTVSAEILSLPLPHFPAERRQTHRQVDKHTQHEKRR